MIEFELHPEKVAGLNPEARRQYEEQYEEWQKAPAQMPDVIRRAAAVAAQMPSEDVVRHTAAVAFGVVGKGPDWRDPEELRKLEKIELVVPAVEQLARRQLERELAAELAQRDADKPEPEARSIVSPEAVQRLNLFLEAEGFSLVQFAAKSKVSVRTLRDFRKTGKISRSRAEDVAHTMNLTLKELTSPLAG